MGYVHSASFTPDINGLTTVTSTSSNAWESSMNYKTARYQSKQSHTIHSIRFSPNTAAKLVPPKVLATVLFGLIPKPFIHYKKKEKKRKESRG